MVVQQRTDWDNAALLEQNRRKLLRELRQRLREYEVRYELSSQGVARELAAGRIRETAEICDWLIIYETYRAIIQGPGEQPA